MKLFRMKRFKMKQFKVKQFQWGYGLFLLLGALWLWAGNAHAGSLYRVDCTAIMSNVNISNAVTPANVDSASITATLDYSCTNRGIRTGYVSVCLGVDSGDYNDTTFPPRYLKNTADSNRKLAFTMRLPERNGVIWGTRVSGSSEYNTGPLEMPRRPGLLGTQSSISGSVLIDVSLIPNDGNALAIPGTYTNNFNAGHTALTFKADEDRSSSNCATEDQDDIRFPFTVQATVVPSCEITATSDVNLGNYSASQTDITGSNNNAIGVTCTNEASYYIGLTPSNDNTNGAGVMKSSGSNTDKVPYQLRSTAGTGGKIWGNTATTTDVGNGVAGIGSGVFQTQTVYVTVPSADFKPDNYSDTVTIRVNY